MYNNPSDVVHHPIFNSVQSLLHPSAELLPETTASAQCFRTTPSALMRAPQSSYPSSNHFYADFRPVHGLSDSQTGIGAILDYRRIQNITARWPASPMAQLSPHEPSALDELTLSCPDEMYIDGPIMEHHHAFMAPTIPQFELLCTETLRNQSGASLYSSSSPISPRGLSTSLGSTPVSPSHADDQSPSQECYTLWKKIPTDAITVTGSNEFVPQTLYKPHTETDKERYLERVLLSPPIIFVTKESLEWGISLEDVRNGRTQCLVDKDVAVLQDCGPSVSIRINWPGYLPFKRPISSRNWRKMKGPITKEKLARSLATTTVRFIEEMSNKPLEVDAETKWKVGTRYIRVEDLILVSLHHVSKGSWQPQFRLRRDIA